MLLNLKICISSAFRNLIGSGLRKFMAIQLLLWVVLLMVMLDSATLVKAAYIDSELNAVESNNQNVATPTPAPSTSSTTNPGVTTVPEYGEFTTNQATSQIDGILEASEKTANGMLSGLNGMIDSTYTSAGLGMWKKPFQLISKVLGWASGAAMALLILRAFGDFLVFLIPQLKDRLSKIWLVSANVDSLSSREKGCILKWAIKTVVEIVVFVVVIAAIQSGALFLIFQLLIGLAFWIVSGLIKGLISWVS